MSIHSLIDSKTHNLELLGALRIRCYRAQKLDPAPISVAFSPSVDFFTGKL